MVRCFQVGYGVAFGVGVLFDNLLYVFGVGVGVCCYFVEKAYFLTLAVEQKRVRLGLVVTFE